MPLILSTYVEKVQQTRVVLLLLFDVMSLSFPFIIKFRVNMPCYGIV